MLVHRDYNHHKRYNHHNRNGYNLTVIHSTLVVKCVQVLDLAKGAPKDSGLVNGNHWP